MKMFTVLMSTLSGENGFVSPTTVGVYADKKSARAAMNAAYAEELKNRELEDNGACDENGDACPGGYFSSDEAGIYDYVNFALGQLLEVVTFVINEVDIPLPNMAAATPKPGKVQSCLILPKGELGSLEPGGMVYAVDRKEASDVRGRIYPLNDKEVFKGTILSVKFTDENEFFVEVLAERDVVKGGTSKHHCIQEYKFGESAFLNRGDAKQALKKGV